MTHKPIYETDLSNLTKDEVDPAVKTAARSSIWRFAWDIKGGDVILVGDSDTHSIIGRGFVNSEVGVRAYRFNAGHAIRESENSQAPWRHEVPVEWDKEFVPFAYVDRAPRFTVTPFVLAQEDDARRQRTVSNEVANDNAEPLLNDLGYMRQTKAMMEGPIVVRSTRQYQILSSPLMGRLLALQSTI